MIGAAQEMYRRSSAETSREFAVRKHSAERDEAADGPKRQDREAGWEILDLKPRLVKTPTPTMSATTIAVATRTETVARHQSDRSTSRAPCLMQPCRRVLRCSVQRSALVQAHALISSAVNEG